MLTMKQLFNQGPKPAFKKFVVVGKLNTLRGIPVKGVTYEITAADRTVVRGTNPEDPKDWINVLTNILNVAVKEGNVKIVK